MLSVKKRCSARFASLLFSRSTSLPSQDPSVSGFAETVDHLTPQQRPSVQASEYQRNEGGEDLDEKQKSFDPSKAIPNVESTPVPEHEEEPGRKHSDSEDLSVVLCPASTRIRRATTTPRRVPWPSAGGNAAEGFRATERSGRTVTRQRRRSTDEGSRTSSKEKRDKRKSFD